MSTVPLTVPESRPGSQHSPVLITGPAWAGDMVMAQSLFKSLKQRAPEQPLDVLAPLWSLPLLERMPEIRRAIPLPAGHGELALLRRWRLARKLRREQYCKAIILPRSFKSALIPFWAGIPERVGFRGECRSLLLTDARHRRPTRSGRVILDKTVWRYLSLGVSRQEAEPYRFEVPEPALAADHDNAKQLAAQLTGQDHQRSKRPAICLCPGAEYGPAKQWPAEQYAALAEQLVTAGYQIWVLGSDKDRAAGALIAPSGSDHRYNLCGQTQLTDVVDLCSLSLLVISNDSGLMHIAAASGVPVIAIYGSSSPDFTPPLTARRQIHRLDLDCSPCFSRECPLGHYRCLRQLSVPQIMASVNTLLTDLPANTTITNPQPDPDIGNIKQQTVTGSQKHV